MDAGYNVTSAFGGVAGWTSLSGSMAFFWLYNRLIKDPLKVLYVYSWWRNISPIDICSRLTAVPAKWWSAAPDRIEECTALLDREFLSFEATILVCLYFGLIVALFTWLLMRCCVINPLVNAIDQTNYRRSPRMKVYPPEFVKPRRALSVGTSPILPRVTPS